MKNLREVNKLINEFDKVKHILYPNQTINEIIINLKPYKFNINNVELYKEQYFKSLYNFMTTSGYFVARPFWQDLIQGNYYDDYIKLLKDYVEVDFLRRSQDYYKIKNYDKSKN